ncbi:MAG: hypothetical protein MZV64_73520 [Ignavibacteriales bacterium]|nr:hypothetical protein [Ignavibacteriales bacterium]
MRAGFLLDAALGFDRNAGVEPHLRLPAGRVLGARRLRGRRSAAMPVAEVTGGRAVDRLPHGRVGPADAGLRPGGGSRTAPSWPTTPRPRRRSSRTAA